LRFSIAFNFSMLLYWYTSLEGFIYEFELKRLANEKVIGLWVGVQSLNFGK